MQQSSPYLCQNQDTQDVQDTQDKRLKTWLKKVFILVILTIPIQTKTHE